MNGNSHADHLNTAREIYNAQQQLVWRRENQEPFGDSPADENPSGLGIFEFDLGFPGQRRDRETGLRYNDQRDAYDAGIGRYTQPEPIGLKGDINLYRYARNNPLTYIDLNGRNPATGAVIGGAIGGPPGAVVGGLIGLCIGIGIGIISQSNSSSAQARCEAECDKQYDFEAAQCEA